MLYSGNDPINVDSLQATFDGAGYLVKYDASGLLKTASVTDTPIGVTIDESSRDQISGSLDAAGSNTVALLPLDGVIYVKCMAIAAGSVKVGMPMYVSQTADTDGYVDNDASNSATLVGHFFGKDGVAIAAGDLVPVAVA
jgi:hypothetical protein